MSSDGPVTPKDVTESKDVGDGPLSKVNPEFDLACVKGLETGTFEDTKSGKTIDMHEIREAGIASSGFTFVPLSQLRDTQNRPVVEGKRYLFRAANHGRDRMTAIEDGKSKRIVNNSKWNGGIFLKLRQRYESRNYIFMIQYPGGGKWLSGTDYDGNDVVLANGSSTSVWMFEDKGCESNGFPSYAIWAEKWGGSEYGHGFWMPEYAVAKAGYDNDYEWRTYTAGKGAPYGWFHIALERHNYNE